MWEQLQSPELQPGESSLLVQEEHHTLKSRKLMKTEVRVESHVLIDPHPEQRDGSLLPY